MESVVRFVLNTVAVTMTAISLCACGSSADSRPFVVIPQTEQISNAEYETVMCGDVDVSIHVTMSADNSGSKSYYADHSEMEVKSINYEEGDEVNKGDVLVEFKSDEIEEEIRDAVAAIEEDTIMLDHILRMKVIYPSSDFSVDEQRLKDDIEFQTARRDEYSAWLEGYSIKAEDEGVVTKVSNVWQQTKVGPDDLLITIDYASGKYSGVTTDDYNFEEGAEYDATVGITGRRIVVDSVTEDGEDEAGRTIRKIEGHLLDASPTDDRSITLDVAKPILRDALYITKNAVECVEKKYYVHVFDEHGIPVSREIEAIPGPNGTILIESGLTEGERVVTKL